MTIDANSFVTADTVVARRLARDRFEKLELDWSGLVIVAVIALAGGPFATVRVEVVHVAHLDLLDALQGFVVVVERWVDALSLLVVAA